MSPSDESETRKPPSAAELVAKLARLEEEASSKLILAPLMRGDARVSVRVSGIVYELKLKNPGFVGWALLHIIAPGVAEYVREADQKQVAQYLSLFPRIRLIALESYANSWWCIPAQRQDARFQVDTAVPLQMPQRLAAFDVIYARFDGRCFFYEGIDRRHNPRIASQYRQYLQDNVQPDEARVIGALPSERDAYRMLYLLNNPHLRSVDPGATGDPERDRIATALSHAGAELDAYWHQNPELVTVRFRLDGQTRTAMVNANDLTLVSAGVCLSGQDALFDLNSLVGVLREYGDPDYD
ncbi:MAG: hypothetical protein K2W95_17220 [Candidatus Obscuribacterales bacterium]|nr:hypothetical protein [Candidatus Obscuribacterales bacterium]